MKAMMRGLAALTLFLLVLGLAGCQPQASDTADTTPSAAEEKPFVKYTSFRLTTDLTVLTEKERQMLPILIEAAQAMDRVFWREAYGDDYQAFLDGIEDEGLRRFAEINYGPWDRLAGDAPFIEGVGEKPAGADFYPADMTKEELEAAAASDPALRSLYTLVRRDEAGKLYAVPYHEAFAEEHALAAGKLRAAAELAEDAGLKRYLELRAEALLTDEYQPSDLAWLDMKSNTIDIVIGPIETYEDALFGAKASHEAYVLVKDKEWSERLSRYAAFLPELQKGLPVADKYKAETPGTDAELNAYDAVYYAGDTNAGSKTIAINLPNDEEVQLQKGTRRLQLQNAMRAKFDEILVPITEVLIAEDQRSHISFDAFFSNTMFHEVAHGLGIKNTVTGKGTVRAALQEHASALEEGKADVLGLYMVTALHEMGEMGEVDLQDYYVTFLGSILRSIRFGSSSAHGVANLIRFNFFAEKGAFSRDEATGTYRVEPEKLAAAVDALSEKILTLQGDGDYEAVQAFVDHYGKEDAQLRSDLDRLAGAGIPIDIVFEQGAQVLGLTPSP